MKVTLRWKDGRTEEREVGADIYGSRFIIPRCVGRPAATDRDFSVFGGGYDAVQFIDDVFRVERRPDGSIRELVHEEERHGEVQS